MEVVLHSKPGCKYCDLAETLLKDMEVAYSKVMYDPADSDYVERRDAMFGAHGHRSFPNVFVNGEFIGGYEQLLSLFESDSDSDF
jgi:glutaredoxin 3